ncbi:MAG: tryptophan synthase alpha chain [Clostridiales bacterium]|jgi:tryptophan synthase alpha chain|nr:tryptophan synthase alpha chain [Clostridiales bacterium]
MSRIKQAFDHGKAFVAFLTAGDPTPQVSTELLIALAESGADLIEIGIPFSDPIAEGPVIQAANMRALSAGTTTETVFEMAKAVRQKTEVPLVFLTYLNPVFHYGYEAFFKKCAEVGVDGIILPDLPFEEKEEVDSVAKQYGVDVISLIAPTSEQRIRMIANEASGFVYLVSSMGVTGVRSEITTDIGKMVSEIKQATDCPVAVGFGISTPEQAAHIGKLADGVIVGSALVKLVEANGEASKPVIEAYVQSIKRALETIE